jgi:hypothetical protein
MTLDLIPGLKVASVEPGQSEPVSFGEFVAPESFSTWFVFSDEKTKKEWDLFLTVTVSKLGTPKLFRVEILGNRSSNLLEPDREGVERWQLKVVEQYRAQLLSLALRLAIETRWPTVMLRREYSLENSALSRSLSNAGITQNQRVLEHPSTITGTLPNGELADFVRFWDGNREPLTAKQLIELQKLIGTKIRKKITPELLARVAEIYNSDGSQLGGKPTLAVQTELNCTSYRTAQDYVAMARKAGLIPPTTPGKVTTGKTTKKGKGSK